MIECQMSYCDKTGGVEPTLRELGHFISTESLTESAPVYGKHSSMVYKSNSDSPKKSVFRRKTTSSARITTLTTEVNRQTQALKKLSSEKEVCKVCQGSHMIFKCSVFLTKSVGWRRRFARLNTLCYDAFPLLIYKESVLKRTDVQRRTVLTLQVIICCYIYLN